MFDGLWEPLLPARYDVQGGEKRMNRVVYTALAFGLLTASASASAQSADESVSPASEAASETAEVSAAEEPVAEEPAPEEDEEAPEAVNDEAYDLRVRDLEERVNQLKMRIYQSKARLVRLQEAVMHGVVSGARALLVHRNEMGSSFLLQEAHYFLDGAPLKQMSNLDGSLGKAEEIELFQGQIVPGNHQLSVNLVYSGNGFGIFSYLRGYRFKIRSSYTFSAEEGKFTEIKVVGYERGGITTDLRERPTVRYDVDVMKDTAQARTEQKSDQPVAKGN
jgi:hypothetical protein